MDVRNALERIAKIEEGLRSLLREVQILKGDLTGEPPPTFKESDMGVRTMMEDVAKGFDDK